jgi:hypothetical protein
MRCTPPRTLAAGIAAVALLVAPGAAAANEAPVPKLNQLQTLQKGDPRPDALAGTSLRKRLGVPNALSNASSASKLRMRGDRVTKGTNRWSYFRSLLIDSYGRIDVYRAFYDMYSTYYGTWFILTADYTCSPSRCLWTENVHLFYWWNGSWHQWY